MDGLLQLRGPDGGGIPGLVFNAIADLSRFSGADHLMAVAFKVREFIPRDSRLGLVACITIHTNAFNRQNRTAGTSGISP